MERLLYNRDGEGKYANAATSAANLHHSSRKCSRGGVGFETSSAECGMEQCWGQKPITTTLELRVSVLVVGNWLGLQISMPDDKQVNASVRFHTKRQN